MGGAVAFCYDLALGGRGIACMLCNSFGLRAGPTNRPLPYWFTLPFACDLGGGRISH